MKATKETMLISSDVLLHSLVSVAPAISRSNIIPILEYVHVTNEYVKATSFSMSITKRYSDPIIKEFSAVIDYNELKAVCANSKGFPISIEVDGSKITIKCVNDVYKLNGEDAINIPAMHTEENPETFEVDEFFIRDMQIASLYVAGEKEARENLRSVMIGPHEDEIQVAGTDAYKMYVSRHKGTIKSKYCVDPSFIIALGEEKEGEIGIGEKNISFTSETLSVVCKLIDATAIDISAYVPKSEKNIIVDRYNFLKAVKKASSLKGITPFTIVDLNFNKEGAEIIYEDFTLERSVKIECQMEHNLDGKTVKLNATDLMCVLNSFADPILNMAYIDQKQPISFLPQDTSKFALLIPLMNLPNTNN